MYCLSSLELPERRLQNNLSHLNQSSYEFENPLIAYHLLSKLDTYEPLRPDLSLKEATKFNYRGTFYGIKTDDHYCEKHRAYFVENPNFMFQEKNFVTSWKMSFDLRSFIIPEIGGNDTMPYVRMSMLDSLKRQPLYDLRLDTQMLIFPYDFRREVNKQFACITQYYNHIPGHDILYRKDQVAEAIRKYMKKYETKPQCLENDKYFLKTWTLTDKEQCSQFFEEFNSEKYQQQKKERNIVYFRKIGAKAHRGEGVFPVDVKEEQYIRNLYKNGKFCGKIKENNLIQHYIYNPLLLNGRKTDFRIYIFIASTNPMIVYYNDGYFSISMTKFNADSKEKGTFLTNARLAEDFFLNSQQNGKYQNMTKKDLWEETVWTFDSFVSYLLDEGIVKDPNWLDNYLRLELMKMVAHLIRMTQESFAKRSSLYEIYGVDVVIDNELNIWFIEANAQPDLEVATLSKGVGEVVKDFMYDTFEVLFGLLRSRTKRIIEYVNGLTREINEWEVIGKEIEIQDLGEKKKEFEIISKNYFESEFEPKRKSKLIKVVDENLLGMEKYSNIIPSECLENGQ